MLGQRAVALLRLLLENAGVPVSKDALVEAGWGGLAVADNNLTVQIAALRRVLAEAANAESWIETLPRRGYRYVGPAVATNGPDVGRRPCRVGTDLPDKPSVAVLPFSNLSGDPEQDYFADGMVDDIITGLARINWLFVIARNSTFTYKGRAVDVKQVGRELGVRYVLEGSVRKAGGSVRVTGQMIDASTGAHVWAERYDRSSDDIFALQDEIALSAVGAIAPSVRQRRNRAGEAQAPRQPRCLRSRAAGPARRRFRHAGAGDESADASRTCDRARAHLCACAWQCRDVPPLLVPSRRPAGGQPCRFDPPRPIGHRPWTGRCARSDAGPDFRSAWMGTIAPLHSPRWKPRSPSARHRR